MTLVQDKSLVDPNHHSVMDFPRRSSGELSSSSLVYTGRCMLMDVIVITNKSDDATGIVYDNTAASGTKLRTLPVKGSEYILGDKEIKVLASNGIYLSLSGTGATAYVTYIPLND